jgi:hypothetical protein
MVKSEHKDKLLLILTGLFVSSILFFGLLSLSEVVSKKWIDIILMSIGYFILLLYVTFTFKNFKQIRKIKLLLFQIGFYVLTMSIAYLIFFKYKLFPVQKKFGVYTITIVALSISSVVLLDYLVKRIEFFRDNKKKI